MKFEVKDGCFSYLKEDIVLNNVSLCVDEGQVISILGPNGGGAQQGRLAGFRCGWRRHGCRA